MKSRRYIQPRVKGGRTPLPSAVLGEIWNRVDSLARQYSVSRSWVIATVLADAFHIRNQADYRSAGSKLKIVRGRKRA